MLFLDEPTLGLDVIAQAVLQAFLRDYNTRHAATVPLTSHYMGDVTALASRVLVIDHGVLRFDGDLATLVEQHAPHCRVRVTLHEPVARDLLAGYGEILDLDGTVVTFAVQRSDTAAVAGWAARRAAR